MPVRDRRCSLVIARSPQGFAAIQTILGLSPVLLASMTKVLKRPTYADGDANGLVLPQIAGFINPV
jgi:hypothetical protein